MPGLKVDRSVCRRIRLKKWIFLRFSGRVWCVSVLAAKKNEWRKFACQDVHWSYPGACWYRSGILYDGDLVGFVSRWRIWWWACGVSFLLKRHHTGVCRVLTSIDPVRRHGRTTRLSKWVLCRTMMCVPLGFVPRWRIWWWACGVSFVLKRHHTGVNFDPICSSPQTW